MYFASKGAKNTDQTIELAIERAKELNIQYVVVASNTGKNAKKMVGRGLNVVCVTHHVGFAAPGGDEMPPDMRTKLSQAGVQILTTTHLFAGVDRALRNQFGGVYPAEIIAQTLRLFGQGTKVAIEISAMALDAGLIPHGEKIIAIGGTGTGADTALIIVPEHSNHFFGTKVLEIICKPGEL